jgi:hypothetical protein
MGNTCIAAERTHVARAKHIVRKAIAFMQMESIAFDCGNARGILPAMLQDLQAVIQQLINGALRNDA